MFAIGIDMMEINQPVILQATANARYRGPDLPQECLDASPARD
jgi:hypothetical protein